MSRGARECLGVPCPGTLCPLTVGKHTGFPRVVHSPLPSALAPAASTLGSSGSRAVQGGREGGRGLSSHCPLAPPHPRLGPGELWGNGVPLSGGPPSISRDPPSAPSLGEPTGLALGLDRQPCPPRPCGAQRKYEPRASLPGKGQPSRPLGGRGGHVLRRAREEGLKGEAGRTLREKAKGDMAEREGGGWFPLQAWGGHFLLGTRWHVWASLVRREMDEESLNCGENPWPLS